VFLRRRVIVCLLPFASAGFVAGEADGPAFDVASIKASNADEHFSAFGGFHRGTFMANNVHLRQVLASAYGVSEPRVIGPDWLDKDRFDFVAKTAEAVSDDQLKPMLQALLKERFQLSSHLEQRTMPVYYLRIAKGGVRMPVYPATDNGSIKPDLFPRPAMIRGAYTTAQFAVPIAMFAGRPVIDETGLTERYSIFVYFASPTRPRGPAQEFEAPDLFTAIQEQLGLKLESGKDSVQVLVVGHMDRTPTEN
jgi:uncharacterized protein (TIGR03435 family)